MIDFTRPILIQKLSTLNVRAKGLTQKQQNTINQVIDYLEIQALRERQAERQGAQG